MTHEEYKAIIRHLGWGKVLPKARYCLKSLEEFETTQLIRELLISVMPLRTTRLPGLIKFHTDRFAVSFLDYPDFWTTSHPVLQRSWIQQFDSEGRAAGGIKILDYSAKANPPILHRKELFLPPVHPRYAEFAAITLKEDQAGLYEDTSRIGTLQGWQDVLRQKGLR